MSQEEAEKLLQSTQEQTRTNTEPSVDEDTPDVKDAIRGAYEDVLDGDASSNSTVRDENLAALLRGLEDAGELASVIADANEELGRDHNPAKNSRNDALKALVRLGLQQVRPDVMDVATDARTEYEVENVDDF